ncbi:hypothetical protein BG011_000621, partial [Mortierella polycephala]
MGGPGKLIARIYLGWNRDMAVFAIRARVSGRRLGIRYHDSRNNNDYLGPVIIENNGLHIFHEVPNCASSGHCYLRSFEGNQNENQGTENFLVQHYEGDKDGNFKSQDD